MMDAVRLSSALALGVALAFSLSAGSADARRKKKPKPPPEEPKPPPEDPKEAEARKWYEKGISDYDLARYPEAIEAFSKAYELTQLPGLLFNIAQAHRLNKDCDNALRFYQRYLGREPDAHNASDVEGYITQMKECVATREREAAEAAERQRLEQERIRKEQEAERIRLENERLERERLERERGGGGEGWKTVDAPPGAGKTKRRMGLIIGASGLVVAGAGIFFGMQAAKASDDITKTCEPGCTWTGEFSDRESDGKMFQTLSIVAYGMGGAAIVTGGVLYFLGAREARPRRVKITPAFLPGGGAGVVWGVNF